MNIKSLLIGSAALATASSGALAADAIVMPDPEPMDYVRICDVYGAGFFYIPGTETCLRIGGYLRYQLNVNAAGFTNEARLQAIFDARSDTEIGTLQGFAAVNIAYRNGTRPGLVGTPPAVAPVTGYGTDTFFDHAYIRLIRGSHSWRFGMTHSPWSSFLGYALFGSQDLGIGFRARNEISYTFTGSNGFSFVAAVVDDEDGNFIPDLEVGFKFERGWGHVGLVGVGDFDNSGYNSGVKGSLLVNFGNSGVSWKSQAVFNTGGWAATTGFNFAFTPKFGMYIQGGAFNSGASILAVLGANITPLGTPEFLIRPEVVYDTGAIGGSLRIQRNF